MTTLPVRDIVPRRGDLKIKVRVSRMWRGKILKPVEKPDGLGCVLVDEHGDSIHAMVMDADVEDVLNNITKGRVYEITKFSSMENQESHQIVPHRAQLLFNNKTVFNLIPEECPEIPMLCFNLMDYNDLPPRIDKDTILTDVIGRITLMHPIGEATSKRIQSKKREFREIVIENSRNQELKVTLWGKHGLNFEVDKILQLPPPVVIVITSSKVKKYLNKMVINTSMNSCVYINPNISEVLDYKTRFCQQFHAPKLITTASSAAIDTSNMISISELIMQDADESKDSTFTCRAKITKIVPVNGWYYLGCPTCSVKLQMEAESALNICRRHGEQVGVPIYKMQISLEDEDNSTLAMLIGETAEKLFKIPCSELMDRGNTDQSVIPQTILDSMNIYKIWQLRFGKRRDFVVWGAYTDTKQTEQEIEEGKTPEKLSYKRRSLTPEDSTLSQSLEVTKKTKRTHNKLVEVFVKFLRSKVLPDAIVSKEDFGEYEEPKQAVDEVAKELSIVSSASQWKHDVFLSFSGPDTRKGIAFSLFYELKSEGIRTFMDEEGLEVGNHIYSNLLAAIEESRSAIVILSPKYASSTWCLDEIVSIVQGWETRNTLVFPVFYNVEPHDVRHQTGSFEEIFTRRGKRKHREKVLNQWKTALTTVANLTGIESKFYSDRQLVEKIVQNVCSQVRDLETESAGYLSQFKATIKNALGKVVEAWNGRHHQ